MLTLFAEGGFPMWFLLAFSVLTLLTAGRFAASPDRTSLRLALSLASATLFTVLTSVSAAIAQVGHHAPDYLAQHPGLTLSTVLLQGLAESLSAAILGFTVLSLCALLLSLGFFRERLL